jgi:hypothetical protein
MADRRAGFGLAQGAGDLFDEQDPRGVQGPLAGRRRRANNCGRAGLEIGRPVKSAEHPVASGRLRKNASMRISSAKIMTPALPAFDSTEGLGPAAWGGAIRSPFCRASFSGCGALATAQLIRLRLSCLEYMAAGVCS